MTGDRPVLWSSQKLCHPERPEIIIRYAISCKFMLNINRDAKNQ